LIIIDMADPHHPLTRPAAVDQKYVPIFVLAPDEGSIIDGEQADADLSGSLTREERKLMVRFDSVWRNAARVDPLGGA
jgi:hypothetical protein